MNLESSLKKLKLKPFWLFFIRSFNPAPRQSWRSSCRLVQVLFACFTRYTISSSTDASFALIAFWIWFVRSLREANGAHWIRDFWICSNSGFFRSLGLIVFFKFGLLFLRSEWNGSHSETVEFVQILDLFIYF